MKNAAWTVFLAIIVALMLAPILAFADGYVESSGSYSEGANIRGNRYDTSGNLKVMKGAASAGEHAADDYVNVESHFTNLPTGATTSRIAGDTAIKNSAGFLHSISCYSDATATAGSVVLRDNTAAGAGNILWSFDVLAVAYNTPFTVFFDVPFTVGLYADYTTTADLFCTITYR